MKTPAVMIYVGDLAFYLGVRNLKDSHAGKLWEHKIDGRWTVKVNPNPATVEGVTPWAMLFEFNGWPACMVDAGGGWTAAGTLANEDTLIKALKTAIKKARNP